MDTKGSLIWSAVIIVSFLAWSIGDSYYSHVQKERAIAKEKAEQAAAIEREKRLPFDKTNEAMKRAADASLHNPDPVKEKDAWGEELIYERQQVETYQFIITIRSKGPDKELGTVDDMFLNVTHVDMTRKAGVFIGNKSKQFVKGVWEGLKKE